jgi:hypothetical protein
VSGELFVGEIAGATALIIDDLISTGNTLLRAAGGARRARCRCTPGHRARHPRPLHRRRE